LPDLANFEAEIGRALITPLAAYFQETEKPITGLGRLVAPLSRRLRQARAINTLRAKLSNVLRVAYQVAASLASEQDRIDERQLGRLFPALAEAEMYLEGFLDDLPGMARAEAGARLLKYVAPILQFYNEILALGLPELPIVPGDKRLECCRKIRACKCHLEVERLGPGNFNVRWMITAQESCRSCKALAVAWNPLRIRNGRIVSREQAT
jgi:hypothetical protein